MCSFFSIMMSFFSGLQSVSAARKMTQSAFNATCAKKNLYKSYNEKQLKVLPQEFMRPLFLNLKSYFDINEKDQITIVISDFYYFAGNKEINTNIISSLINDLYVFSNDLMEFNLAAVIVLYNMHHQCNDREFKQLVLNAKKEVRGYKKQEYRKVLLDYAKRYIYSFLFSKCKSVRTLPIELISSDAVKGIEKLADSDKELSLVCLRFISNVVCCLDYDIIKSVRHIFSSTIRDMGKNVDSFNILWQVFKTKDEFMC